MKTSTRIAFNTATTYARSLLTVGLALFSSRWILNALGVTDYGLFNVVGALIIFLSFFSSVMAGSAARHFAFAIGQGDSEEVNRWFNASLIIHLLLPAGLVAAGWPLGEYVVRRVLTIPPERVDACVMVFRISLIPAFVNMASIPFIAMFTARQRLAELAFWGVLQAVFIFGLAWSLQGVTLDRLLFYAAGMAAIHVLVPVLQVIRARGLFPECRVRVSAGLNIQRFRELFGFALWTLVGRAGGTLRNQGSSILITLQFGPAVNAAYGIANQVSVQTASLSAAMMGAVSPEITAREGRGQREGMIRLSLRACKFGTLLVLLFAVPFILDAGLVLRLWLVHPPAHAAVLSQLMMATFVVDKLSGGYLYAVNAYGRIAAYQTTVGTLLLLTLPVAWLFLRLGMDPAGVGIAFLLVQALCSIGRVLWARRLFGVPAGLWLSEVVVPCAVVAAAAGLAAALPRVLLSPGWTRLLLVCAVAAAAALGTCWKAALSGDEKDLILSALRSGRRRIGA